MVSLLLKDTSRNQWPKDRQDIYIVYIGDQKRFTIGIWDPERKVFLMANSNFVIENVKFWSSCSAPLLLK